MGPDGAVYICDWYNSIICHQDDPFRHPDRDFAHGRIWRVTHKSSKPIERPELHDATNVQLLSQLKSPERWIRYHAKAVLADRDRYEVAESVAGYWRNESAKGHEPDEHLLYELIGVLESVEVPNVELLEQLLIAKDHRARAYAARVVARWFEPIPNPLAMLRPLAHDDHPQVRMEAIVAAAHIPSPTSAEIATIPADYEMDYDLDYAMTQALHHLKEHWIREFNAGELAGTWKDQDRFADRLAIAIQKVESKQLLETTRRMATSKQYSKETNLAMLRALVRAGDSEDIAAVLERASDHPQHARQLLEDMVAAQRERSLDAPAGIDGRLREFLKHEEAADPAISLVGAWKVDSLVNELLDLASAGQLNAVKTLGNFDREDVNRLLTNLATSGSTAQRTSAISGLCTNNLHDSAQLFAQLISSSKTVDDESLGNVVDAFSCRKDGFAVLANSLEDVNLNEPNAANLLNALNAFGTTDSRLIAYLNKKANRTSSLPEYSEDVLARLVKAIPSGDARRGAKVFYSKQANCHSCHRVSGQGGVTGPDLSGVGTTLPADRLVQEVFWPRRLVKEGYTLRQVVTEDGEVLQGYVRKSRNKKELLLRPLNSEQLLRVRKDQIEHQQDVGSAMPENIVATLSADQRVDLLAFLSQLGTPDGFTGLPAHGGVK